MVALPPGDLQHLPHLQYLQHLQHLGPAVEGGGDILHKMFSTSELQFYTRILSAEYSNDFLPFLEMKISSFLTKVREYMESSTLHGMR